MTRTHPDRLLREACVNLDLGRLPEARRALEAVLGGDPHHERARSLLAETLHRMGDHDAADRVAAELTSHRELGGVAAQQRARVALARLEELQRRGGWALVTNRRRLTMQALTHAREAVRQCPGDLDAAITNSCALAAGWRRRQAVAEARRAVALAGEAPRDRAKALANLAVQLIHTTGGRREARRAVDGATALDPESSYVVGARAYVQLYSGQAAESLRTAVDELRRSPTEDVLPRIARFAVAELAVGLAQCSLAATLGSLLAMLWPMFVGAPAGTGLDGPEAGWRAGAVGLVVLTAGTLVVLRALRHAGVRAAVLRFARRSAVAVVGAGGIALMALLFAACAVARPPPGPMLLGLLLATSVHGGAVRVLRERSWARGWR